MLQDCLGVVLGVQNGLISRLSPLSFCYIFILFLIIQDVELSVLLSLASRRFIPSFDRIESILQGLRLHSDKSDTLDIIQHIFSLFLTDIAATALSKLPLHCLVIESVAFRM